VKVLSPELSEQLSLERFEREIRLVAALQHPGNGRWEESIPISQFPRVVLAGTQTFAGNCLTIPSVSVSAIDSA
jgi:hypothetical protein